MLETGILLAVLSGIANGLFTAPMKLEKRFQWEHIWFAFIFVSCLVMPGLVVAVQVGNPLRILATSPRSAIIAALTFGFAWGFGAICFGRSVDRLGVSLANTLVIGLSSALGSLVPLMMAGPIHLGGREAMLFAGVLAFLTGVVICGLAGRRRDRGDGAADVRPSSAGFLFAIAAGVMSAVFNIGYAMALPISDTGYGMGYSRFAATNCIWLLMLGAGSVPNIAYCLTLMIRRGTTGLMVGPSAAISWSRSAVMGLLWGGSIFLYGAATPRLGALGPSIGWPLSLAVGLLVANLMGVLLGEWRAAGKLAINYMYVGLGFLFSAIVLCASSTRIGL